MRVSFITKSFIYVIIICAIIEAIIAQMQYAGYIESNHPYFYVTGTFNNPCILGIISTLGIIFSIGMTLNHKAKSPYKIISVAIGAFLFFTLFLSGSRAAFVGLFVGIIALIMNHNPLKKHLNGYNFAYLPIIIILCVSLYALSPESCLGRLLIWRVSLNMLLDKPIFGWGINGFRANYMNFQAEYLRDNPDSVFADLAGSSAYPFNELIQIAIDWGIIGLSFAIYFLCRVLHSSPSAEDSGVLKSGVISVLMFGLFSYPLQVPVIAITFYIMLALIIANSNLAHRFKYISMGILSLLTIVSVGRATMVFYGKEIAYIPRTMLINLSMMHELSIELQPDIADIYAQRVYQSLPDTLSIPILEKIVGRYPNPGLLIDLANKHLARGNVMEAENLYIHASNMIPGLIVPRYKLFNLYLENGRREEAKRVGEIIVTQRLKVRSTKALQMQHDVKEKMKDLK